MASASVVEGTCRRRREVNTRGRVTPWEVLEMYRYRKGVRAALDSEWCTSARTVVEGPARCTMLLFPEEYREEYGRELGHGRVKRGPPLCEGHLAKLRRGYTGEAIAARSLR
jgi:hypothetical protein